MATVFLTAAVAIGSSVAANLIQGTSKPDSGNIDIPKSNYGVVLPQCWGTVEIAGNLLWATKIKKKKKRRKRKNFGNFAYVFAHCPFNAAQEIEILKFNNRSSYSTTTTDQDAIEASIKFRDRYLRFYLGTATQNPDPLIEEKTPISNYSHGLPGDYDDRQDLIQQLGLPANSVTVPAYRKKVYIVAENLPLIDYGNQIPKIKARIRFHDQIFLDQIVREICLQVGISETDIDASELSTTQIEGFYIDKVTKAQDAIQTLQDAFFFDSFRSGGKLIFSRQSSSRPSVQIPYNYLAAHQEGKQRPKTFEIDDSFVEDLPKSVEVNYINRRIDYDSDNAKAETQNPNTNKRTTFNLNVIMRADHADAIASKHLHKLWLEKTRIKFTLPPTLGYLEVGDRPRIELSKNKYSTVELLKVDIGADRSLKCQGKIIDAAVTEVVNNYSSVADPGGYDSVATENYGAVTVQGATSLEILDINLISDRDLDNTIYLAGYGGVNWDEAIIYKSVDDITYIEVEDIEDKGVVGSLNTAFDENSTSFEVTLNSGELESISASDASLGFNYLLVGNEILQFQNQTLTGNNQYSIQDILARGLRGTENFINSHTVGERVVLLTGNNAVITKLVFESSDLNQLQYLKAPSGTETLNDARAQQFTYLGNNLKPYAPVDLKATVDNVGNITISWTRRDRHAGSRTDYENFPLSETREEWEIDILDNSVIKRTYSSFVSNLVYTVGDQLIDFGAVVSSVTVSVYQVSATVGRGYSATATLTPTLQEATPVITDFSPKSGLVGDTITVYGSGLSNLTEVAIESVLGTNLAVVSDSEINFVVGTGTESGTIKVTTVGGTAISANSFVINSTATGSGFTGFVTVSGSRSLADSDLGKILVCDTSSANITITLDETALTNPANFNCRVFNQGANRVIFASSSTFLSQLLELVITNSAINLYYQDPGVWYGI
ncbi:MAG: phage tail protein [Xenococcus sp. (in: cyanobacteria)]